MPPSTFTVSQLANEAEIDIDEALIVLWDGGIPYVNGPASTVRRGDSKKARKLVGLATRRELSSKKMWQKLFALDDGKYCQLLQSLNVSTSESSRYSKKAINKLRAEAKRRGLSWSGAIEIRHGIGVEDAPNKPQSQPTSPPLVWKPIGKERDLKYVAGDDVRAIHEELVREFANDNDPIAPAGVRDENLLGSAVSRPFTSIGETKKYPSAEMAAAALLHSIIHDHPFHNGNKRTALVSMLAFMDLNGLMVTCAEHQLFKIVIQIAQHSIVPFTSDRFPDREVFFISKWISDRSRSIELGDRTVPFRRLRKLLSRYGCTYNYATRGNQIQISRTITRRKWALWGNQQTLSTQTYYGGEGRDLNKTSVAKVRKDLQLDEPHGIDSASFYENAPAAADEFIIKYRKTLSRLASL